MHDTLMREPIYKQLNEMLRALIRAGTYTPGQRFLSEREVVERFGVSRPTANKALSALVAEGVLLFRKGVGTFVRDRAIGYDLRTLVSFTEKAHAAGKRPQTRVLHFQLLDGGAAPEAIREALRIGAGDGVYALERLRLADELPVILERRYIVSRWCPNLKSAQVGASLYAIWTEVYGLHIIGADETIQAINIQAEDARLLDLREGAAGLLVLSTGYLAGDIPLWYERTLYRGDAYAFYNRVGGMG